MTSRTFLVLFFGAILAALALSIYLSLTAERASRTAEAVLSPDGRFKATRSRTVAPKVCLDDVIVRFAVYPDALQEKRNLYEVYAGVCSPADAPPTLEWLSERALRISYTPPAGKPPTLQMLDITKAVTVTFVARGH